MDVAVKEARGTCDGCGCVGSPRTVMDVAVKEAQGTGDGSGCEGSPRNR